MNRLICHDVQRLPFAFCQAEKKTMYPSPIAYARPGFFRGRLWLALLLAGTTLLPFCKKEVETTPKPILDLIAKQTNCTCEPYIDEYRWQSKVVYVFSCKGPACFCGSEFYDAEGNLVGQGLSLHDFRQGATFKRHVWSCDEP